MSGVIIVHGGVGAKGSSLEDMNGVASKSKDDDPLKTVVNAVRYMEISEQNKGGRLQQ